MTELAPRRRQIAIAVIATTILVDLVGYSILIPVLPRFEETLGATPQQISLLSGLYAMGLVLFLPLWGWVSDRIGRRPVLLISLLGTVVSFLLLAFAETMNELFAARLLGGFFGATIGTAQAFITDLTDDESRTQGMGTIGAASGVGLVLGTALGGVLGSIDPDLPFYATAGIAMLNLAIAFWALPESKAVAPVERGLRGFARALVPAPLLVVGSVHDARTRLWLFLFFHVFFAFSAIESAFPLFAHARFGWSELKIGLFFSVICVVLGCVQALLVGPLSRIFGEKSLVGAGMLITGGSLIALGLSHGPALLCASALGVALGAGLAFPPITSLFSKTCGSDAAGEYLSQSQAMVHTGRALGALCWGSAFAALGVGSPFILSGLALFAAFVLFASTSRLLVQQA